MRTTEKREHVETATKVTTQDVVLCDGCDARAPDADGYDVIDDRHRPVPNPEGWVIVARSGGCNEPALVLGDLCPSCGEAVTKCLNDIVRARREGRVPR